jgi:hypothetical protein
MAGQLQRVLSNNPALTAPASEGLSCCPPREGEHLQGAADGSSSNRVVVEQVKNGNGIPLSTLRESPSMISDGEELSGILVQRGFSICSKPVKKLKPFFIFSSLIETPPLTNPKQGHPF